MLGRGRLKFRRERPILSAEPMSPRIPPITATPPAAPRGPVAPRVRAAADAAAISPGAVPASPPPEVLDAVDAAARCFERLHAQGRELRFERDDASGRVLVQVRDLDGNVLRTIPPSRALDVATGAALD